jgi:hypothetical protein
MSQNMDALHLANQLRLARAQARKDVGAGRRTVADVLADPCCATARVHEVLMWQARWGVQSANRFLRVHEICTPFQTAGNLTERQRVLIAKALRVSGRIAA